MTRPAPVTPMPAPTVEQLRAALEALGVDACLDHAPSNNAEHVSGLLAALLAAVQRHIQDRSHHSLIIDEAYHNTRDHLGFPPCNCGSPCDTGHRS